MKPLTTTLEQREKLEEMARELFPEMRFIQFVGETILMNPDNPISFLDGESIAMGWYEFVCRHLAPKVIYHDPPWRNDYERLQNFLASHVHDDKQHPIDKLYEIYESTRSNVSKRKLSSNQVS